jgi:uncharacterized protein (TIGR02246 family)
MKYLLFISTLFFSSTFTSAQEMNHDHDAMMEINEVKKVLFAYKSALENLDVSNTLHLFAEDATVFENGKFEGSYQDYLDNHIGPELGHFKEFSFDDYQVTVRLEGNLAVAHETYIYKIVLDGENPRTVERKGVATSVLKKFDDSWKIIQNHGSSRANQ